MAGDWLKIRCDLLDDPDVISMATRLKRSEFEVVGMLIKAWTFATRQTVDGDARGVTKTFLDRYVSVTGFSDAMIFVGWLREKSSGICFENFHRYMANSAKIRSQTALRQEKYRNKMSRTQRHENVTVEKRREEKMKKEKKEERKENLSPSKNSFNTTEIMRQWNSLAEAGGLHKITKMTAGRIRHYRARLSDDPDFWDKLTLAIQRRGEWARQHQFPTFVQAINPEKYQRLVEGEYEDQKQKDRKEDYELGDDGILRRKK